MKELTSLLLDWHHWAFEVISGAVFFFGGAITPTSINPAKRWLARHDRVKHGR